MSYKLFALTRVLQLSMKQIGRQSLFFAYAFWLYILYCLLSYPLLLTTYT